MELGPGRLAHPLTALHPICAYCIYMQDIAMIRGTGLQRWNSPVTFAPKSSIVEIGHKTCHSPTLPVEILHVSHVVTIHNTVASH
jgi:hypothetical protein